MTEELEKTKRSKIFNFFHHLTHQDFSLIRGDIGEIYLCFRRIRPRWVTVTLLGNDDEECQIRIPCVQMADFIHDVSESSNSWEAHMVLHKFRARLSE